MSGQRALDILARLRRQELAGVRQAMAQAQRALDSATAERQAVWRAAAQAPAADGSGADLHAQGLLLTAARARAHRLDGEIPALQAARGRLLEEARAALARCRQIELAAGHRAALERQALLRRQQLAADERAMRGPGAA